MKSYPDINLYPYIGEGIKSGTLVMMVKPECGLVIKSKTWATKDGKFETSIDESYVKNITHEYLANTYGEVVSPEHAEFIIKLARANNIEFCKSFRSGLFFNFYRRKDSRKLVLFFFHEDKAKEEGEKQIKIPLPPRQTQIARGEIDGIHVNTDINKLVFKADKVKVATPEEEFEMEQIMKNAGDNLVLGCESQLPKSNAKAEMPRVKECKDDEWPKIGDEVLVYSSARRLMEIKGKVVKVIGKCTHSDGPTIITVEHSSLGVFAVANGSWIKKPKTPEEELRDDIIELTLSHMENKSHPIEANAYYLFSDLIDKYNITKKPQ